MKQRFLIIAASVFASVSLASAQGLSGGGATPEKELSVSSAASQLQTRTNLTPQQQTTLQQSVLHADNAPRANVNSINFQVHTGVAVPSNVSVASVSTYPALVDAFPDYRDYNFFVVEDDVVFVDRERRIVDVVPAGPRTHFSGGGHGSSGSGVADDLSFQDIRIVQRVLKDNGFLRGETDGVLGPQSRAAIRAFQRQHGIQVTGSIDARTILSLGVTGRMSRQAKKSIGQSPSSPAGAAVDLSSDDIRVVQIVLIDRGLLQGEADGVLGPKTRAAISAFQRQQSIPVSASIDAGTISSLGVSGRLSRLANQSIGRSQSFSPTGAQTSTTGHGQAGTGQVLTGQPQPSQQNATGQAPSLASGQPLNQTTGQVGRPRAQKSQSSTTGRSTASNQSYAAGQAAQRTQQENERIGNKNVPSNALSLTFTSTAIGFLLLAFGAFIIVPAI